MKKNENAKKHICPKCGKAYTGHPATSRDDNYTDVCPECGVRESMASMGVDEAETERVLEVMRKAHAI